MAQDHRHPSRLATGLSALLAATAGAGPFVLVTTETAQAVEVSARSHSSHLSTQEASERRRHRAEEQRERRRRADSLLRRIGPVPVVAVCQPAGGVTTAPPGALMIRTQGAGRACP